MRFAWSGSSFEARFTGPSITMLMRTPDLEPQMVEVQGRPMYSVKVDDGPDTSFVVSHDRERYALATGLDPAKTHDVRVVRESEAFAGVHELLGVELGEGGKLLPVRPRARRIEVIGDSISCGYGVLGGPSPCSFSYVTERASAAYGARLGRALDADVTTVCWSGRGVVRNYDGSTTGTMPQLFETTLPEPPQVQWSFKAPPPDAVIVNLGTNDFLGDHGKPLDLAAFEFAYVQFMRRVRELYPAAWIFVTTSPMLKEEPSSSGAGTVKEIAHRILRKVVARRENEGENRMELVVLDTDAARWGCDGHPDVEMNGRIAARLEAAIRSRLPQ